jgi:hypothetical protein
MIFLKMQNKAWRNGENNHLFSKFPLPYRLFFHCEGDQTKRVQPNKCLHLAYLIDGWERIKNDKNESDLSIFHS